MDGESLAVFLGLTVTAIVVIVFITVFVKLAKAEQVKKRMEEYKRKKAEEEAVYAGEMERRRKEELMSRLAKKRESYGYDRPSTGDAARKHELHVEDSHAHGHTGEEEHYEEIVGSLGEINDEGCADLSGVRFLANDLAYEIQTQEQMDYDRLAQAIVLGEIVNSPRFKTPYSKRK